MVNDPVITYPRISIALSRTLPGETNHPNAFFAMTATTKMTRAMMPIILIACIMMRI